MWFLFGLIWIFKKVLTLHRLGRSHLDVVPWALGVNHPKDVTDRSMVAPAYARGEIVRIAELGAHDVKAKSAICRLVRDHVLRYRADWLWPTGYDSGPAPEGASRQRNPSSCRNRLGPVQSPVCSTQDRRRSTLARVIAT